MSTNGAFVYTTSSSGRQPGNFFESARLVGRTLPEHASFNLIEHLNRCVTSHGISVLAGLLAGLRGVQIENEC